MPSYTFVSTANAFCLRGVTPVFVDIRKDTLNLDEKLVKDAITPKTKAVVAVHYAGIACEMDFLANLCQKYNILLSSEPTNLEPYTTSATPEFIGLINLL